MLHLLNQGVNFLPPTPIFFTLSGGIDHWTTGDWNAIRAVGSSFKTADSYTWYYLQDLQPEDTWNDLLSSSSFTWDAPHYWNNSSLSSTGRKDVILYMATYFGFQR